MVMVPHLQQLQILHADNFTPRQRTPWAGKAIARLYKQEILPQSAGAAIGESWEFSCDPDFPSRLKTSEQTLSQLVNDHSEAVLSPGLARGAFPTCEILVKLLNADDPLSLQVHPTDADSALTAQECGKPESWYVLDVEPGCGLYLGFKQTLTPESLRELLQGPPEALKQQLQFVPVKPGDYFEIAPGVPHAIGPGVTLLEPQRILFGKSGKTYRLWDWGRRYNKEGLVDSKGQGRPLHIEESLRIIDLKTTWGADFVQQLRREPISYVLDRKAGRLKFFPANPYYQVIVGELAADGYVDLSLLDGYAAWVQLQGRIDTVGTNGRTVSITKGESALLPYVAAPLRARAVTPAIFALVIPAQAELRFA